MSKRSREASFSPSAGLTSSDASISDADSDEVAHALKKSAISEALSPVGPVMQCSMPPHKGSLQFSTIDAFEVHYAKDHSNRCASCGKNFPSPHFLGLHIDEHHNPIQAELQAKGEKTYGCFVEDCEKKCSKPAKRRLHLIDKHAFPKTYNFNVVARGIDQANSMLQEPKSHKRRVSTSNAPADAAVRRRRASSELMNGHEPKPVTQQKPSNINEVPEARTSSHESHETRQHQALDDLEKSMSALIFVPPSVQRHQTRKPVG